MPEVFVTQILCMLVGNGLIVDFCTIDAPIQLAPQAVNQRATCAESFLVRIQIVLQIGWQTTFPSPLTLYLVHFVHSFYFS